jgi:hypothetical protein
VNDHVVWGQGGDGAAHAVVDGERLARGEVLVAVVLAQHYPVTGDEAAPGEGDFAAEL